MRWPPPLPGPLRRLLARKAQAPAAAGEVPALLQELRAGVERQAQILHRLDQQIQPGSPLSDPLETALESHSELHDSIDAMFRLLRGGQAAGGTD